VQLHHPRFGTPDEAQPCSLWTCISTKLKDMKRSSIHQSNSYLTVDGDASSERGLEEASSAGLDCLADIADMAECDSFSVLDAVDAIAGYKRIQLLLWQGLLEEHQLQCHSLRLLRVRG
jgi:hypothetical protein